MGDCMNEEQQFPEDKQAAKPQWNTLRNKNVSIRHDNTSKFRLIPCPLFHQITRWKHRRMTHLIQVQGKNQTRPLHITLKWILNCMNFFYLISLMEMTQWTQYWILQQNFCLPFVLAYYRLMLHGTIIFILFMSGNYIGIFFGKMALVDNHNGGNFLMIWCNR